VTCATISLSGALVWILLGLGVGVWGSLWWELRDRKNAPEDDPGGVSGGFRLAGETQKAESSESRAVTVRRCAVAYLATVLACFAVALVAGGEGIAILAGANVVVAAIVVVRSWPASRRRDLPREIVALYRGPR
jgi:hypothetical protein